jgi:hypothetical protein
LVLTYGKNQKTRAHQYRIVSKGLGRSEKAERQKEKETQSSNKRQVKYKQSTNGRMSALGQKQTFAVQNVMSALPPKADIERLGRNVR